MSAGDGLARRGGTAAVVLALAVLASGVFVAGAGAAEPLRIAVFDFVLRDKSAGGGIVEADARDLENLQASGEAARAGLAGSGRYSLVETEGAPEEALAAAGGILDCRGCEAALARELGADRSLAGIVTRVARTEYTLQIVIRDAASGEILANDFSGLRLGANYSWPRGVKRMIAKRVAATEAAAGAEGAGAGTAGTDAGAAGADALRPAEVPPAVTQSGAAGRAEVAAAGAVPDEAGAGAGSVEPGAAEAGPAKVGAAEHRLVLMPPEIEGDLSLPGGTEAWQRRLDLIEETVGRGLAEEGLYRVLDTAPAADLFAEYRQQAAVHQCVACLRKVAARLGAERVLTLRVHRMSQLVLNLHAVLRDGETGKVRYARLLSFRGDNDRAWLRASQFLMRDLGRIPREKL